MQAPGRLGWIWLLVPALGLLELAGQLAFAARAPTADDWQRASAAVAQMRAEAESSETPIIVAPDWAEPTARLILDDPLLPLEHLARPDERGFERVLEISTMGQQAPSVVDWPTTSERREGPFVLRLRENPDWSQPKYRFADHVFPPDLFVSVLSPAADVRCTFTEQARRQTGGLAGAPAFPRRRFLCPGGARFFVGVTVIDGSAEYRPHRCIWAHPGQRGPVQLRFRGVPAGRVIRGYGMRPWLLERRLRGAPVELTVRVDGEPVGTYRHSDGEGWRPFAFPMPVLDVETEAETEADGADRAMVDVEFEVSAPPSSDRSFCFYSEMD